MKKFSINRLFDNDKFLRVFSLVVAVLAWIVITTVVNTDTQSVVRNVMISTDLTDTSVEKNGLSIANMSQTTADVNVSGTYKIGLLNKNNVDVVMDLSRVTEAGTYDIELRPRKREDISGISDSDYELESTQPRRIQVEFERKATKSFTPEVSTPNITAADGLFTEKSVVTPNEISVSGPKPLMDSITKCRVETQEEATLSKSQTFEGTLKFYDENDSEISGEQMNRLEYNKEVISITVLVYKKVTVPLTFDFINVPAGIDTKKIKYKMSADKINVGIPVDAATELEEIKLGQIDFQKIDVGSIFPFEEVPLLAGYINIDSLKDVTVSFPDKEDGYTSAKFSSETIVLKNQPANYDVKVLTKRVSDIKIVGSEDVIKNLKSTDIVVTVDCEKANLSEGDSRVNVSISLAGNQQAWAVGDDYSVLIRVKGKS